MGENTEKYISFSVPTKKEHDNDNDKTITCKLKFIDTCRFMQSKLSDLVNNLSEIFIPMSKWTAGKDLMKNHYHLKKIL